MPPPKRTRAGFDLYCWDDASQSYRWLALWTPAGHARPWPIAAYGELTGGAPLPALTAGATREFVLYLPLYNGVKYVSIGVEGWAHIIIWGLQNRFSAPGKEMGSYFRLKRGVQIPYLIHENQTPRSDSAISVPVEPIPVRPTTTAELLYLIGVITPIK